VTLGAGLSALFLLTRRRIRPEKAASNIINKLGNYIVD
jgi:hypothetical protein